MVFPVRLLAGRAAVEGLIRAAVGWGGVVGGSVTAARAELRCDGFADSAGPVREVRCHGAMMALLNPRE